MAHISNSSKLVSTLLERRTVHAEIIGLKTTEHKVTQFSIKNAILNNSIHIQQLRHCSYTIYKSDLLPQGHFVTKLVKQIHSQ